MDLRTVEAMVSALSMQKDWSRAEEAEPELGIGATSSTASTSLWTSNQVSVVCDGNIYNRREIQAAPTIHSDELNLARLFARLYLEQGPMFLGRLRGVFALAIWDFRSKALLLAVDRFGVKTLCYSARPSEIIFASQPRGILASARVERQVDLWAIVNYLGHSVVPSPLCVFQSIQKLPPAHFALWQDGALRTAPYWEMDYFEDAESSEDGLSRELEVRMHEAVDQTSHGVPVGKLGCFLSGGTDSSSIVGLLTKIRQGPVNALSVGFTEQRFDELEYARLAARHFGARHFESLVGPHDAYSILPRIAALYDEPFGNSSVIPTYFCQEMAARIGIKVMLAGDGGDELFGGNEHYRTDQVYQFYHRIPETLRRGLIEPVISLVPLDTPGIGKIPRYIRSANTANPDRYFRWRLLQYFDPEKVLGPEMPFRNGHSDLLEIARGHYQSARAKSELNRLLYLDTKMILGDNDLPKVVRSSELAGIDVRFPFLDHPLAEFSGRIPSHLKLKGSTKRYLFKRSTRNLLPKAILRKRKHGFGLPIGIWLKTDPKIRAMAQDVLRDSRTYQRGYFRRDFIDYLFAGLDQDHTPYFGDVLYLFLMLELWHRKHVEVGV